MIWIHSVHTMKNIRLSQNINYTPLRDEDGDFGILTWHINGEVIKIVSVESREEMKETLSHWLYNEEESVEV